MKREPEKGGLIWISVGKRNGACVCNPIQKCAKLSCGRPNVHQICQFWRAGFSVHSRHLPKTRAVYIEGTKIRQMELAHVAVQNTSPIFWGSVIPRVPVCRSEHFPNFLRECWDDDELAGKIGRLRQVAASAPSVDNH